MSNEAGIGRPVEYTPERIAEIAKKLREYTEKTALPLWCEFCHTNKVNFRLARDLCKKSEEFREAYEEMHAKEETALLRGGLAGKMNSPMAQLVLKNHRMSVDYREKEDFSGKMDHSIFFEEMVKKAAARRAKRESDKAGKSGPNT